MWARTRSRWAAEISGPTWVCRSRACPIRSRSCAGDESAREGVVHRTPWTNSREAAKQTSPFGRRCRQRRRGPPCLEVGVGADTNALLPPSSISEGRRSLGRGAMIWRAAPAPPVKLILAMPGWATSAAPTSGPKPVTTLTTPAREEVGQQQCQLDHARGGELGRLEHHRVAGSERRRQLLGARDQRRVPGNDGGDGAERLADRVHVRAAGRRWERSPGARAGEAGEVAEDAAGGGDVGDRHLPTGAAVLGGEELLPAPGLVLDRIGDREQATLPQRRAAVAPAGEGAGCRRDRRRHVLVARLADPGPLAARAGIDGGEVVAGRDLLARDQQRVGPPAAVQRERRERACERHEKAPLGSWTEDDIAGGDGSRTAGPAPPR